MPKPLMDGSIEYEDGTEATMSQMAAILRSPLCSEFCIAKCAKVLTFENLCQAKDVTTFLCRASEPEHDGKRERARARGREKRESEGEREREEREESESESAERGIRQTEERMREREKPCTQTTKKKLCLLTRRRVCAIMPAV